jgi:hypothetical protein
MDIAHPHDGQEHHLLCVAPMRGLIVALVDCPSFIQAELYHLRPNKQLRIEISVSQRLITPQLATY